MKGRSSFVYRYVGLYIVQDLIDFDYASDIHLSVINYTPNSITVPAKKRVAQFVFERTDAQSITLVEVKKFDKYELLRRSRNQGFGHTGE